jgi:hypothetical protein
MADATRTLETILTSKDTTRGGFTAAGRAAKTFADGTIGHFKRITSSVLNLKTLLAGGLIGGAINKLTSNGDEIDKLSQRVSVTAEEFQVLRHAMELGGSGASGIETAFRSLTRRVFDLQSGSTEGKDSLEALGLTLADLQNKTPMQQFKTVFTALGQIEDASTRSAVAQEMFGRSGLSLIPVLNATGGSLDSLADKMRRNGQLLSTEQIAKSAKFRDSLTDLNRTIQASLFDVLEAQIGDLSAAIDTLVESGKLQQWGSTAASVVQTLYGALSDLAGFIARHRETLPTLGITYVVLRIIRSATAAIRLLKLEMAAAGTQAGVLKSAVMGIGSGVATAGVAYLISLIIQMGNEARKTSAELRAMEADGTVATGALADHARKGAVGQFFGNLGEVLTGSNGGFDIKTTAPSASQIANAKRRRGTGTPGSTPSTGSTGAMPPEDAALAAFTDRLGGGNEANAAAFLANGEDPDEAGREAFLANRRKFLANADKLAKLKRDLTAAQAKQEADSVEAAADLKAAALRDAQRDELDQLRQHASALETAAQAAAKTAQEAWDAILNPQTASEKRAEHDAERAQDKLERRLATAREKQARGLHLNKRSKEVIAADDQRQAAADLGIRAAAEGDHFRADQAAFNAPPMPAAPATGGPDLAAILEQIATHTAAMAQHGIL